MSARGPSFLYPMGKLVRRYWVGIGLGGLALVALIATSTMAMLQGRTAAQEAERAATARDFLLQLFNEASPDRLGGEELSAVQLLEQGRAKVDARLTRQPRLQAELLEGIGNTQYQVRDMGGAEAALVKAVELYRLLGDPEHEASAQISRMRVALMERRYDALERIVREMQRVLVTIGKNRLLLLSWLNLRGRQASYLNDQVTARTLLLQCIELANPRNAKEATIAFDSRLVLAVALAAMGDPKGAKEQLLAAEALPTKYSELPETDRSFDLADARSFVDMYSDQWAALSSWLPNSISLCEKDFGRHSLRCGVLRQKRLWTLLRMGEVAQAWSEVAEMESMLNQKMARHARFSTAILLTRISTVHGQADGWTEPMKILRRFTQEDAPDPFPLNLQLQANNVLGEKLLIAGKPDLAQHYLDRAADIAATMPKGMQDGDVRRSHFSRGLALQAKGMHREALSAMAFLCNQGHKKVLDSLLSLNCVRSLIETGDKAQAIDIVRRALLVLSERLGANAPNTRRARRLLEELEAPGEFRQPAWQRASVFIAHFALPASGIDS